MKFPRIILAATLVVAPSVAMADGGGVLTIGGKEFALKSAYAYTRPDPFDGSKQSTVIAFSGRSIDVQKIGKAADPAAALSEALDSYTPDKETRPVKVELIVARTGAAFPIQQISFSIPDLSASASVGAARYKLDLVHNDGKRIEGTLRSANDSDKTTGRSGHYDLQFSLDVHAEAGG